VKVSGRKTVRAFHQHEAEEAGRRVSLEVTKEGDAVVIKAFQSGDTDNSFIATDLEITVPKGARIQGRGRRGDFDITGITGDVEIDSDNAGIMLVNAVGNVGGHYGWRYPSGSGVRRGQDRSADGVSRR
jgi:hypothetical protein